jgi:hypothetical protein
VALIELRAGDSRTVKEYKSRVLSAKLMNGATRTRIFTG